LSLKLKLWAFEAHQDITLPDEWKLPQPVFLVLLGRGGMQHYGNTKNLIALVLRAKQDVGLWKLEAESVKCYERIGIVDMTDESTEEESKRFFDWSLYQKSSVAIV